MRPGLKIINQVFSRKPYSRVRTESYWTETYPSPEPSFLKKTITKCCDFVYNSIDSFFQGNSNRIAININANNTLLNESNTDNSRVWELNQGVTDIALKDLKGSINWVLPGFVKTSVDRMGQYFMLYFYTDMVFETEPFTDEEEYSKVALNLANNSKTIYVLQSLNKRFNAKYLSVIDWYMELYHKVSELFKWAPETKTYYLLGFFGPQGNDNWSHEHDFMIRGPDRPNINPPFSYHKRN